ncbi:glycosyltransferase family 9 protein [Pontibacter sp. SGAir0037]|uniref:glycosyltransferase family 9 protein n=1 Tax=Pontibacter sp. SGAir0037 TaxID=2571030 RepID=UPI0010CCD650|nr:glycosyltransferase family 9 protein [Pontibacter sp. SGAir0037]QCR24559.1 glycosyl transferase [Pontibacter sp. SGAir0037]
MKKENLKILVIRFSSIGDIIYTTPVVRALKQQLPGAEIHFLTKKSFSFMFNHNPYVDRLHLLKDKLSDTIKDLKAEKYDYVIDLHNSLRSAMVKVALGVKSSTYKKERIKKVLAIRFKINKIEPVHLVDRYFKAVKFLGVANDQQPIDYFLAGDYQVEHLLPESHHKGYVAFIIGATHFTKRMPNEKVISICRSLQKPVVLLGGKDVEENGRIIQQGAGAHVVSTCGKISMNESVFLVKQADKVIGFDTGLTHISEAFNKDLVSIWGSTVPELLGVQPYLVSNHYEAGVELPCRPCSKFGLPKCPLGHFKCMHDIDEASIVAFANRD